MNELSLNRNDEATKRKKLASLKKEIIATSIVLPVVIGFCAFTLFPMIFSLVVSFTELHSYNVKYAEWTGWSNYEFLLTVDLQSGWFGTSLKNIAIYMVCVPFNLVLAIFLANHLSKKVRGSKFMRVIMFMPQVVSGVAITMVFKWMFQEDFGMINTALSAMATQTIYVSRAEQLSLFRRTQNQSGDSPYDLTFAQEQGAWTNHLLCLKNTAKAYRLLVDGEEVFFTDDKYQFAVPSNLGEEDDSYSVEYWDEYGNYYAFTVHLFRKTPTVTLSTEETLLNVNGATCLRGEFAYVWDGDLNAVYTRNGENQDTYAKGDMLSEDGAYVFTFTDIAGNTTMRMLTVDTKVLYRLTSNSKDVESGANTDSGVSLHTLGEKFTVQVKKDGETYKTDTMLFDEHGFYELVLTDEIGNTKEIKFTIYKKAQKSFNFTVDEEYAILQVWYYQDGNNAISLVDGVVIENGKQSYHFAPNGEYDGKYQLELVHLPTGTTNTLNLVIDNTPPEVALTGVEPFMSTREDVMISGLKAGDVVVLYKDNRSKPYMIYQIENDGDTPQFTKPGEYKIVIYDEAGNSVEYEFVREFKTNTASNVVICLLMLFMAIGGLIYIRLNGKIRVK